MTNILIIIIFLDFPTFPLLLFLLPKDPIHSTTSSHYVSLGSSWL